MKVEDLKRLKDQRPFQPFRLRLTDGHKIEIKHPDAVSWDVGASRTVFAISGGQHYWLDIALVTALESHVAADRPNGGA
jgi:hypothetical protein